MCGIAGIIDFSGRPVAPDRLQRCCALLAHRGPDDHGTWVRHHQRLSVGLAHTRLAVIDPRPQGRQPMMDCSGRYVVVFNGTVYNYPDLRRELLELGQRFETETDTEVLLNGYAAWGEAVLDRLDGMWALCMYDIEKHRGMLVRDRFGIKPLVYSLHDGELAFASEMSVLGSISSAPQRISPAALAHYLRFGYVAQPQTIFREFHRLVPGHILRFGEGGADPPHRYHFLRIREEFRNMDYPEACAEVRRRVAAGVERRRIADVPVGALLSGGLDSSVVVHHLASASETLKTFSLGYHDQPRYDETGYARVVARHYATDHHPLQVGFADVLEHIPQMFDHLGEPFADASLIPVSLVSRHVRRAVKVALSGDGADELFGGYYRYLGHHYLARYGRIPRVLRRGLLEPLLAVLPAAKSGALSNRVRQIRKLLRTDADDPLVRHAFWSRILSTESEHVLDPAAELPPALRASARDLIGAAACDAWSHDPVNQVLLLDLHHQLPGDMLTKVDLASMVHGLEVRVPMLSLPLVELLCGLPGHFKVQGGKRKRLLSDAYRGILPTAVFRRRKMGFELPIGEFLRAPLRDMFLSTVTRDILQDLPPLSHDGVMQLYDDHCRRRDEHADVLYAILVLCWWQRRRGSSA